MNNETISTLYKKLYTITKELLDNYTDDSAIETISHRGELLKKIGQIQVNTKSIDPETRAIMAKIIELDKVFTKTVNGRMGAIKIELNGLYSKSRAVTAYAANKK